jgi:hypothetical protein
MGQTFHFQLTEQSNGRERIAPLLNAVIANVRSLDAAHCLKILPG